MIQSNTLNANIPFTELLDLASEKVGGQTLQTNDDFFAPMTNLLKAAAPVFIADKYTENGKWMDGWESRRKRGPGNDWCVIKLGLPGVIKGINVDTRFFVGNFPEYCSLEACQSEVELKSSKWTQIVPKTKLQGGTHNFLSVQDTNRWTHVRLNIFPDGGVARLRVHGEVRTDWTKLGTNGNPIDLAAAENGGVVVACNDSFFGPKDNLILPGRASTMGEGWETRRRRGPGFDWIIVKLGNAGIVQKIEVDTHHFKGNFPESCSLEGCMINGEDFLSCDFRDSKNLAWEEILPRIQLKGHTQHFFEKELRTAGKTFTHIRLNIFPDGGISRLRVWGTYGRT